VRFLADKKSGLFDMFDVLGLNELGAATRSAAPENAT
jgi:hypothetical protein